MAETEFGVVLFGGRTFHLDKYSESFNDVWLFDGRSWSLIHQIPTAPRPRARYAAAFAPTENGVLLFGGAGDSENDHLSDSWLLNINGTNLTESTWEELQSYPTPRGRWCMSGAQCGKGMLMMGGSIDYRISSKETWLWEPKVLPSPWGTEHDSLGEWTSEEDAYYTNAGYGMVSYIMGEANAGVFRFGGV